MAATEIAWTGYVWNAVAGCLRVSPGCGGGTPETGKAQGGCYAETMAARIVRMGGYEWRDGQWVDDPKKKRTPASRANADRYRALVRINKHGEAQWTGEFAFNTAKLAEPLSWRSPRLVFVNSMSDLFGEGLSFNQIAAVFGVMAGCPGSTFQVLTKRIARAVKFFEWLEELAESIGANAAEVCTIEAVNHCAEVDRVSRPWPLPNVWLGVSCERQQEADDRVPKLLSCPAAVRWVSAEPLLGPIDFTKLAAFKSPPWPTPIGGEPYLDALRGFGMRPSPATGVLIETNTERLDWIVYGGESGHGARPCDLRWIAQGLLDCSRAGVSAFVKQVGAQPFGHIADFGLLIDDKKGADPKEWPSVLRVRDWPAGFTPPKSKALPVVESP